MSFLRRIIQVRPGEGKPVFLVLALSFSVISATITGKTARDTFFLNQFDVSLLPLMFVATAIAVGLFVPLYSRLLKARGPFFTIAITGSIAAVTLMAIQLFLTHWLIPVLYVWMEVVATILSFQIWGFAGELFSSRQAKRLYGLLAAGGSLSFIIIGLWLQPFISEYGSESILYLTILFILIAIGLTRSIKKIPRRKDIKPDVEKLASVQKESLFTPYLKSVAFMTVMIGIATTIVDFQFKYFAGSTLTNADALAIFFGKFYAITGAASLVMQMFITGRLLSILGILAGLLILPFSLIIGFSFFLYQPALSSAFMGRFAEQTFTFTLHQPTIQLLWIPVKKWRKQFGKPFIDGTLRTTVDGLTGLATFFIIKAASIAVITIIGIVASILWVGSAFYIRKGYIQTLNEALAARRLNFDDLQIGSINHAMVDTIDSSLKTGDVYEQLFILELIQSLPPKHWKETLESLMVTGSNPVRKAILQYAGDLFDDDVIVELVKEPFLDAIPICGKRKCEQAISALTQLLNHESSEVRISAAGSLIRIGTESSEQASSIIQNAISDEDPYIIARGLNNAILDESILSDERLIQFLQHDTSMIRIAAMSLATQSPQDDYLPFIIENLGSPKTSGIARNSLEGFKDDLILASIQKMSEEPNLTTTMKNGMISTLSNIPSPRSQQLLLSFFNPSRIDTYESAADALLTMAESTRLSKPTLKHVQSSIRFLAKKDYSLHQFRYLLRNYNHTTLLIDTLDADATSIMPVLIKLGAMDSPGVPINQCIKSLKSNDPAQVSYGLDLMETIFSREEREIVTPLIEHRSLQERVRTGKKLFRSISKNIYFYMEDFLYSESQWKSAIALEFLLNSTHSYKGPVRWDSVPVSHLHAELLHRVDADNYRWIGNLPDSLRNFPPSKIMFTTLEKTIMLKSVPLFKDIPAEVISAIAQISEEVQTEADSVLFKEGDSGDSMFVIVEGDIRIHKGEKVIATLSKWDCLGEMALLDEEPRSADATAASDGIILQISQDSFSELMQQHPNIMKSLLKILTGRLRNVI